ncbi:hypothetical protein [Listeria booriae]|uniref:hypothetical protein n=1 Tax=Listeria booriae TaxID=1552123 RepID=UPI001626F6C5|nr:hypothetical protein [Listeria booriae]MBC1983021.1 hypothetical protein [Listeria booriae]
MTKIYVVCGFPASGKSTYVMNRLGTNDLVYDYDELMRCISGLPMWQSNKNVLPYLMDFYKRLLINIKYEKLISNVYIIKVFLDEQTLSIFNKCDNVQYLFIDTDPNVCLSRLKDRVDHCRNYEELLQKCIDKKNKGEYDMCEFIK